MSDMLLGPILRDLESILPREGLKRNLRELVSDLKTQVNGSPYDLSGRESSGASFSFRREGASFELEEEEGSPRTRHEVGKQTSGNGVIESNPSPTAEAPLTEERFTKSEVDINTLVVLDDTMSENSEITEVDAANSETTDLETESQSGGGVQIAPPEEDDDIEEELTEAIAKVDTPISESNTSPNPIPESLETTVRIAPKPDRAGHSEQQLEQAVLHFAQIDHTKLVAAVRFNGDIAVSRGTGVDLSTLSRLGLLGLRISGKSGRPNSYYLAHTQGQLFLFPLGNDTIFIVGTPELNLGAVFTGLTSLKEEL
ncbi:MAG: hypothetical protein JSV66_03805 [Trueperaceae bacterium]|nr:MAG: hypothetical protein JSV66_03805 [Trueperaceae bacterium]